MGHLWKTIKNDLLNPKAAAADFQKLSVSAVRQATVVMSSVAENAEAEMTNLHDQLLGGKRNLPDHPGGHLGCNVRGIAAALCDTPPGRRFMPHSRRPQNPSIPHRIFDNRLARGVRTKIGI